MKIYNKKIFAWFFFMVGLGALNLTADIAGRSIDWKGILLAAALFLFGISAIMRSLSKKMTREDKLEELDERNQLIEWKSKAQSFRLTQVISFLFMLALLVMGKISGHKDFIAIGMRLV